MKKKREGRVQERAYMGGGGYDGLAGWRSNDSSAQPRDSFMKAPELSGTADDYPQGLSVCCATDAQAMRQTSHFCSVQLLVFKFFIQLLNCSSVLCLFLLCKKRGASEL
jgi:hypothetical protein